MGWGVGGGSLTGASTTELVQTSSRFGVQSCWNDKAVALLTITGDIMGLKGNT